jgi:hypothetical protein
MLGRLVTRVVTAAAAWAFAIAVLMLGAIACTDRQIVAVDGEAPPVVDDQVDVSASFCTRPVSDVTFPVKLIMVMDSSGSLQFTDQPELRLVAVRRLMSSLATQGNVQVATIAFNAGVSTDPPVTPGSPLYVPASQWVEPPFLRARELTTSYQDALSALKSHLLNDLLTSDPAEIVRTKYVIILFSDGTPKPKCCINVDETVGEIGAMPFGCEPDPWEVEDVDPDNRYCEGEEELLFCNSPSALDTARRAVSVDSPPDYGDGAFLSHNSLEPNSNYNRTYQLENLVSDVMDLGEEFGVGELRLHTVLLFDSTASDSNRRANGLNRCRSERLLQRLAELGNGLFRDFESGGEIDFLAFNFTSLKQSYSLLRAYAHNASALPPAIAGNVRRELQVLDFRADTDGDGLDDAEELALGTDVAVRDSDKLQSQPAATQIPEPIADPAAWGDGWSDAFEARRIDVGFDPRFQSLPVDPCPSFSDDGLDRQDLDSDGVNGCEEGLLGTDPERADSDGDGLSDGLEVRVDTDPVRAEANRDDDFDGVPNADEIQRGTNPKVPDLTLIERAGVATELRNTGTTSDGRTCYTATARGVRLASTQPRFAGGRSGYNDVLFFLAETPSDESSRVELRVACHRAQYLAPSLKNPADGRITLREEDFFDLADPADLQALADGTDLCRGLDVQ